MEVKTYEVILKLVDIKDLDDELEQAANAIYEVRDDAFVYATGGAAYVELSQKAVSGFDAILGAQVDIKKAGYNSKLVKDKGR